MRAFFRHKAPGERGAVLVFVIFALACLLAIAAIVLDAGTLYRTQLVLQKAADAGAMAGMGMTMVEKKAGTNLRYSFDDSTDRTTIHDRALAVAVQNMQAGGLMNIVNPTVVVSPGTLTPYTRPFITVDAVNTPRFLLLDLVPWWLLKTNGPAQVQVNAAAKIERREANIGLLLDFSSSMGCPSEDNLNATYCKCLRPTRESTEDCSQEAVRIGNAAGYPVSQKFVDLRNAVQEFVSYFDPLRDRIGLITFSTVAKVGVHVKTVADGRGFDKAVIDQAIVTAATSGPSGNTNVADAFITAYQDFADAGIFAATVNGKPEKISFVYFSDGAPTAGRFALTDGAVKSGVDVNTYAVNAGGITAGNHDYIHYTIQWVQQASATYPSGQNHAGPSLLVKKSSLLDNMTGLQFVRNDFPNTSVLPTCYTLPFAMPTSGLEADHLSVFTPCLNNFEYHDPAAPGVTHDALYVPTAGNSYSLGTRWADLYANSALHAANFVRKNKHVKVFVIGLGQPAPRAAQCANANDCTEAYQDPLSDTWGRKDLFLASMAHDCTRINNGSYLQFSFFSSNDDKCQPSSDPKAQGEYLSGMSSAQLTGLFSKVAQRIMLQLTE